MTWHLHPARERFAAFAVEWDRLNGELYNHHPFFDSRFIGPLLEHFGDSRELLCLHLKADSTIDGALIVRPLGLGRWALFAPAQTQAGAVMLKDAGLLDTLLPALPGVAWSLDLLSIDPVFAPDWSALRLPRIVIPHTMTMAVATDGDFNRYWQARPKKLRDNTRRYQRRAEEAAGPLAVTTHAKPDAVVAALAHYGQLESAGWKGREGTAIAPGNQQGRFYADTLGRFAARGQARVMELHAGERLIASRLFIRHKRMWIALKTTYNETYSAFAPGRLLLRAVLEHAFADMPDGAVEFYTNATRDQAEWATALRSISHQQLFRNEALAALYGRSKRARGRLLWHARLSKNSPKPDPFDLRQLTIHSNIAELPPAALELLNNHAIASFDHCNDWFRNLQQTVYANDSGIRYYVMNFAGRPVAILPLRQAQHGLVRSIHSLSNYYTALYAPILAADASSADLTPLLAAAIRDQGGTHSLRFAPMDPSAPAYETLLTALRSIGCIPFRFLCFGNWYLPVASSWQDYFSQREGQLRSTIKRKGKKFSAAGGTLEIITDPAHAETAIAAFNHVYAHSWKKPEPHPDFIPGLIRWLAARGWLRLGIARLDGNPIAAQIWIVNHGKANIFKLAFDEAFTEHAPGTLLTAHLMKHVFEQDKVKEVDYLIGDDPYKVSWMSQRRERWGIVAYNPRTSVGLALLATEALWRLGNRLFSHKALPSDIKHDTTPPHQPMQTLPPRAAPRNLVWRFYPAAEFPNLAATWQSVCDTTIRSPLLSADFVGVALRHFGRGNEFVCLAESAGNIVAATILERKNPLAWQTFQPSQMPLGPWLQPPQTRFTEVATSLLRQLPGPALIFAATQLDSDFYPREDCPEGITLDCITTGRIVLAPDMESFMSSGSVKDNPKLAAELMRRIRKTEKNHGAVTLEVETAPAAAKAFVNHYATIESRSWKAAGGTALAPDDVQAKFYADLMHQYALRGTARMYTLKFGDTAVAQQIAIAENGVMVLLKTTYEPEYRSLGPGVIQMHQVIRDALEEKDRIRIIELYGPFNDSQKLWVSETRTIYHANVYRHPLLAKLHRQWIAHRKQNRG